LQLTPEDYLTCMEMYGNGAGIYTGHIQAERKRIQQERLQAAAVLCAAEAGTIPPSTSAQLTGLIMTPAAGLTISVSVLSDSSN